MVHKYAILIIESALKNNNLSAGVGRRQAEEGQMIDRLQQWLHRLIVQVPGEVSVCEFECHKQQCLQGDWQRCTRRLRGLSERAARKEQRPG